MAHLAVRQLCRVVIHSFFRDVTVMGMERIPIYGPVIFVGNHNNQFVDATMLCAMLPRQLRFVIAEHSLSRPIIGQFAKLAGSIPVKRPADCIYDGLGLVWWSECGSSTIQGNDRTRFLIDAHVGDYILLGAGVKSSIVEIISDSEMIVGEPLPPPPENPKPFQILPKIDQAEAYEAVTDALKAGQTIAIFPEGGSHDRTDMLPLKVGVAVMALSSAAETEEDVIVIPVGLHYYQAHKILSSATVQIGQPMVVSRHLVDLYRSNRKEAVGRLMEQVTAGLRECTIRAPNYSALKATRLCATLFAPEKQILPNERYHQLYHVFSKLFYHHNDDPEIVHLRDQLKDYQTLLSQYGIPDREVWQLRCSFEEAVSLLGQKFVLLFFVSVVGLPLAPLWIPMRLASNYLAERHRKAALLASSVKLKGTDVMASFKILTMMVLVPTANLLYGFLFGILFTSRSLTAIVLSMIVAVVILPPGYYLSIRSVAKMMPLILQIRCMLLVLLGKIDVWRETEKEIIRQRMSMQLRVRKIVDSLIRESSSGNLSQSNSGTDFGSPALPPPLHAELERCIPRVLLDADTRRLRHRMGGYEPLSGAYLLDSREEIL